MVTPTFGIRASGRAAAARATPTDAAPLRYRLDVVAASAADVVESAGGWLYDRVMAGWEVTVRLPHSCDTRALRILGVRVSDCRSGWYETQIADQSLAVSAAAFRADPRVRRRVLASLDGRLTEVALWGDGWPLNVDRAMSRAQHVLSAAARTFKGHALAAAGIVGDAVAPVEPLRCDAWSPAEPQLVRLEHGSDKTQEFRR
ncbi:hypothetical protein [Mycobacterium helveticum]|jgi:hypothetical protein|uniref:Uncharacterized protein n=1 Tax=Mycobacterium helveticum TaxID=2592811 RepID=A0A557XQ74_9MYCO|nr:hypothetical protein [Mycobacterium helveticum]TVS85448.1 hypothetical protein FPZ46_14515 [Mycobacterium helveticum]TVS88059.1 hypothetical protein FPZ47_14760 [Mycobacterium helveticum]